MNIAFYTFGCKVNQSEEESLKSDLGTYGHTLARSFDEADAVVINTCSVTESASKKCYQFISKLKRKNSAVKIIATGCLAEQDQDEMRKGGVDLIISNFGKDELFKYLSENEDCIVPVSEQTTLAKSVAVQQPGSKTRAFLKIQDGCDSFCSYCIIPYLRGTPRSKKIDDILDEFRIMLQQGFKEIVLVGIHIGKYGLDFDNNTKLDDLLEKLIAAEGVYRIRLSSIEVGEVTPKLIKLMKDNPEKICSHLHIPLQSGSTSILERMNRKYNAEDYIQIARLAKNSIPNLTIGADVIVGFPGETDEQFNETINTIKLASIDFLHVFPYSDRESTPASVLNDKVSDKVKSDRSDYLRKFGEALTYASAEKVAGSTLRVLSERGGKGLSDSYFHVQFMDKSIPKNLFCTTRIIGVAHDGTLIGEVESYD